MSEASEAKVGSAASSRAATARRSVLVAVVVAAAVSCVAFVSIVAFRALRPEGDPHRVVLAAGGNEYSARLLHARHGDLEVTFANTDAVTHTFTVPELGVDLVVASGEAGTASFRARPGTYRYLCTVPGHDGPGMRGELRVR